MNHLSTLSKFSKNAAAGLLLTLPAITTAASYAHGHGSLGGAALGIIVSACIAAGAWGAGLLLQSNRNAQKLQTQDPALCPSR